MTEIHFKQQSTGDYVLRAILKCGETVFTTTYQNKEVFFDVFNRNRTLQGVVVFMDNDEWQAVGELGFKTFQLRWAPTAQIIGKVEARNERAAIRLSPLPYRKYLGEIYAEQLV